MQTALHTPANFVPLPMFETTLAERGQVVIPKKARDALGFLPNMKLEIVVERDQLVIRKTHKLNLSAWIGCVPDDGLTTDQVMQELRGRPVPYAKKPTKSK